jgi:type I restriction enzyme, S subunit
VIAGLKPYADYKDSGLSWLGQMPAHWRAQRSKYLFREADERSIAGVEQRLSMSQRHGLIPSSQIEERRLVSATNIGGKLCEPGDLVLNRLKAHLGVLAVAPTSGVVSPDYTVLRPLGTTNHNYFCAVYRSPHCGQELRRRAKGIVEGFWRLYTDDFYDIRVPVPPPDEQASIVSFLDWANGRLERAIRAKRKVIALLAEQRQAVIQRAVARGFDPAVRCKPSGDSWLGEIPEHWSVWRISRFARVGNGSTPSRARPGYWNGGTYPWLNSSQVNRASIDSADQFITRAALRECHLPRVPAGSVLVAITGQGKTRGKAAPLAIEATINQHIAYITPRLPIVSTNYLHLALTAAYRQLRAISDDAGSTKGALTCEDLKRLKIALPPLQEQEDLIERIRTETGALTAAAGRLEREIELLREYSTRLVADVVTGQLDVREAALQLPVETSLGLGVELEDEADDSELIDEEATEA